MHPYILHLGPLTISSYGLMLAISFIISLNLTQKRGQTQGLKPEFIESYAMWLIFWGVMGCRFLFIFVEQGSRNWSQPWVFFKIWEGGLSFTGGLIFATIYTLWKAKKEKISFLKIADIVAPVVALSLCIAKIGCFLAGCCHGKACTLPWAVTFNNTDSLAPQGVPLHPSQLYESLMALVVFGMLTWLWKRRKFEGQIFLAFLMCYGSARVLLEFTRGSEPIYSYGLSGPQTMFSIMVVASAIAWPVLSKRKLN